MQPLIRAYIHNGKIETDTPVSLPEGTQLLVISAEDDPNWARLNESVLDKIWNNEADDCYAELLDD